MLKVEHFLGPKSTAQQQLLGPWCEKIAKESGGKLKCQIYPAMQLGGTPPQLFDQAKDGVVDIVWTIPTYQAGRFVKSEVFELPYLIKTAETGSPALWEYIQKNSLDEFKGTKLILAHVHDGAQLHFTTKDVKTLEDLKGLKVRAPTRISTKVLTALGAVPVQMPVPQVPEAMAKGVVDGASLPWEVVPALKIDEIAKTHTESAPGQPTMSNTIFVVAMNQAKYDSLPPELKKVIDANSGIAASQLGRQDLGRHDRAGAQVGAGAQGDDQRADARGVRALEEGDRRRRQGLDRRGQRQRRERCGAARRREGADQEERRVVSGVRRRRARPVPARGRADHAVARAAACGRPSS